MARAFYNSSTFNVTYGSKLYADENEKISIDSKGWTLLTKDSGLLNMLRGLFS